jgi:nucleoside-diphosphate-sugar epimerase
VDAPEAGNNRFLITNGSVTSQEIADILRAKVPGAEERVPKGEPGKNTLSEDAFSADTSKARRLLGLEYTSKEKTFEDVGRQLLEIEKGSK